MQRGLRVSATGGHRVHSRSSTRSDRLDEYGLVRKLPVEPVDDALDNDDILAADADRSIRSAFGTARELSSIMVPHDRVNRINTILIEIVRSGLTMTGRGSST
jgi:hypothetical protein